MILIDGDFDDRYVYLCNCSGIYFSPFFFNAPATTEIYTLSLHERSSDLLAENIDAVFFMFEATPAGFAGRISYVSPIRSEEHTSELQSHHELVCRLLLEKKQKDDSSIRVLKNRMRADAPRPIIICVL